MKYLSIYTPDPRNANTPPSNEHMEQMGKLIEESIRAGTLVTTGAILPVSQGGARVRRTGEEIALVDGPFAESKEVVAGFAILEARSREHLLEMARDFLKIAGDGLTEIYPIMEPDQRADCVS